HALRAVGYLTSYSHAGRYLHPRTHPAVRLQRPLAVSPDWLLLAGNLARHPDPFGGDLTGRPDPHRTPGPPASARARHPASPGARPRTATQTIPRRLRLPQRQAQASFPAMGGTTETRTARGLRRLWRPHERTEDDSALGKNSGSRFVPRSGNHLCLRFPPEARPPRGHRALLLFGSAALAP